MLLTRSSRIVVLAATCSCLFAQTAMRPNAGFRTNLLPPGDDAPSSPAVNLGFSANFFGVTFTQVYVNHNGNITFSGPNGTYTPESLDQLPVQILAPFWADVDTRGNTPPTAAQDIRYGTDVVNGRPAFGVNWTLVGYFPSQIDKRNTFQLVLIDRSDTGPGNFDIEFNYAQIEWEVGSASGGVNGLCLAGPPTCFPASVGYSNGTGQNGTYLSLPGSLVPGAFLDSSPTALRTRTLNSNVPGRLVFRAQNGSIPPPLPVPTPANLRFVSSNRAIPPSQVVVFDRPVQLRTPPTNSVWPVVAFEPPGSNGTTLRVAVNPASLAALPFGTHTDTIRVADATDPNSTVDVPVTLIINPLINPSNLTATPASLVFTSVNRSIPAPQFVDVNLLSSAVTQVNTPVGVNWMATAFVPPGTNGTRLSVAINNTVTTLPAGTYSGSITFTPVAGGNPVAVPVTLIVQIVQSPEPLPSFPPVQIPSTAAVCPSTTLMVGQAYSARFSATGGGLIDWNIGGTVPSGLRVVGDAVSGVPNLAGTYTYTVEASSGPYSDRRTCTVTVVPGPLRIATGCPSSAVPQGSYFVLPVIPSGGMGGTSYEYSATGLPAGLSVSNGQVRGNPTAEPGTYTTRIQVTSGGQTATLDCSFTVSEPVDRPAERLQVSGQCPTQAFTVGQTVNLPLNASGGSTYQFRISSGPAWLSVTSSGGTGMLTGIPNEPGNYPITVTVTDGSSSATFNCTIAVNAPPLTISGGVCPGPTLLGDSFNIPLSASGGRGSMNWRIEGPSWVTLNASSGSSVVVSGIAPDVGEFPFAVIVTDGDGVSRRFACTLVVTARPLQLTAAQGCPATVERPAGLSLDLSAAGGVAPLRWELQGPSWLSLNTVTGPTVRLSGVPVAQGTYSFTVTVRDDRGATPATFSCTINVPAITAPTVQITGLTAAVGATQTGDLELRLSAPAPANLRATLNVVLVPNVDILNFTALGNPWVQFGPLTAAGSTGPTTVQRYTIETTIPAGEQNVPLGARVNLSNVAGTVRVQLTSLRDGDQNLLPAGPVPQAEFVIARQAPVILQDSVRFTRSELVFEGTSNTLDIQSVTLTFNPREGSEIENNQVPFSTELQTAVQRVFRDRFTAAQGGNLTAPLMGSMFRLTFPLTIEGDSDAIESVTISVTNSVGTTQSGPHALR